jgi:hypothetical protein
MYNLKISPRAKRVIESYIIAYRDSFIELYTDTGLGYAETIIQEQYILGAETLRNTLYIAIGNTLKAENILGYSYNQFANTYMVTMSIGSRRVFLEYTQDEENQTRVLQDIAIVRK